MIGSALHDRQQSPLADTDYDKGKYTLSQGAKQGEQAQKTRTPWGISVRRFKMQGEELATSTGAACRHFSDCGLVVS